jgi:hypothetical protein
MDRAQGIPDPGIQENTYRAKYPKLIETTTLLSLVMKKEKK